MTAGSGFPAEWWTPPADVAMRERTPWEALFGCSVGSQGSTRREGQRAGRRTLQEAESSQEDETSSKDGADGGRRETARARVKIRGRGGSGEPNAPAIRPHTKLQGAPNPREGAQIGVTRTAQRQAKLEPPEGEDVQGRPSGPLDTLEGRGAKASRLLTLRSRAAPRPSVPVDVQVLGLGRVEVQSRGSPQPGLDPPPQTPSPERQPTADRDPGAAASYLTSTWRGAPHSSQSSWMHADIICGTAEG